MEICLEKDICFRVFWSFQDVWYWDLSILVSECFSVVKMCERRITQAIAYGLGFIAGVHFLFGNVSNTFHLRLWPFHTEMAKIAVINTARLLSVRRSGNWVLSKAAAKLSLAQIKKPLKTKSVPEAKALFEFRWQFTGFHFGQSTMMILLEVKRVGIV